MTPKEIDERINRLSQGKCMFLQKIFQQVGAEEKELLTNKTTKTMNLDDKRKVLQDLEQALIEKMADFLDSEDTILKLSLEELEELTAREKSDLHISMAKAAFDVLVQGVKVKSF